MFVLFPSFGLSNYISDLWIAKDECWIIDFDFRQPKPKHVHELWQKCHLQLSPQQKHPLAATHICNFEYSITQRCLRHNIFTQKTQGLTEKSYVNMKRDQKCQSILISGQQGSGKVCENKSKTKNRKLAFNHLFRNKRLNLWNMWPSFWRIRHPNWSQICRAITKLWKSTKFWNLSEMPKPSKIIIRADL